MCSVTDLADNNQYFIDTKRKAIQCLHRLLSSVDQRIDTLAEDAGHREVEPKIKTRVSAERHGFRTTKSDVCLNRNIVPKDLMFQTNGVLSFFDSEKCEQKRHQLAEERRQEYNDFLQQKSKKDSEKTKKIKRVTKDIPFIDNYNELLDRKRSEERKHRELNGFDGSDQMEVEIDSLPQFGCTPFPKVDTIGMFHTSNNKYDPEFITPRSRLLATHSSRLKAIQYREELKKQIEEKEKIKEQERERTQLEDKELEQKLQAQRRKLLMEYETEQRLIKQKAEESKVNDDINKKLLNKELSSSPLSLLRSPTYMHIKGVQPLGHSPTKSRFTSKSLASVMSDSAKTTHTMATQTSEDQKALSSDEESIFGDEKETTDEQNKELEFRQRVLSQLSDVRRMMESDHIKLREELRRQMSETDN